MIREIAHACMLMHAHACSCMLMHALVRDAVSSPVVQRHPRQNWKPCACSLWCEAFAPQTASGRLHTPSSMPLHHRRYCALRKKNLLPPSHPDAMGRCQQLTQPESRKNRTFRKIFKKINEIIEVRFGPFLARI